MRTLLSFPCGERGRFSYRAVAVVVGAGRVLLHRVETDDFWALPGGRVELGESATVAVRREMREELGVDVAVERVLWVVETFFDDRKSGVFFHEHALYILVSLPPGSDLPERPVFDGVEEGLRLIFRWFPIAELPAVTLYPPFLRTKLQALPPTPEYFVDDERA